MVGSLGVPELLFLFLAVLAIWWFFKSRENSDD